MEQVRKEIKRLQKQVKQLRKVEVPTLNDLKAQLDSIVKPIWQKTANNETVQATMEALGSFGASYLIPAVSKVSPGAAEQLEETINQIAKRYEQLQRRQRTAPHVSKSKMKALVYDKMSAGGVKVVEREVPKPGSEEILVKVLAVGLNHRDYQKQKGQIPLLASVEGRGFGTDFCGVIEELGWYKGDRVHTFPFALGKPVFGISDGTVAEYVVCSVDSVSEFPPEMSATEGAALPLCGTTALELLRSGGMAEGASVAVIGATGGVGNLVVQLANTMGAAEVVGLTSEEHMEAAKAIGASKVLTYDSDNLGGEIPQHSLDLVIDCYGKVAGPSKNYEALFKPLLKEEGKFVALNAHPLDRARKAFSSSTGLNLQRKGFDAATGGSVTSEELNMLSTKYESGEVKPLVAQLVPFSEEAIQEAIQRLQESHNPGKIVVDLTQ